MSRATRTVKVRFDGSASGLVAATAQAKSAMKSVQKDADRASGGLRSIAVAAARVAPVAGYTAAALGGLSGVLATLPGIAFAGVLGVGALAVGLKGFGKAMEDIGDPAKFAEALKGLSPAARDTAVAIRGLMPQFTALKNAVQDTLFTGMAAQVTSLSGALLPVLRAQLVATAGSINSVGTAFAIWMKTPSTVGDINAALGGSQGLLDGVLRALRPLAATFLHLGVVAAPYLQKLGTSIAEAATRLERFVAAARDSGALAEWVGAGVETFKSLGRTLGSLWQSVVNLAAAFDAAGLPTTLEMIAGALEMVTGFIRAHAEVMVPLINAIALLTLGYKAMMVVNSVMAAVQMFTQATGLAAVATKAVTAAQWLWNYAMLANPSMWVVLGIVALIAAIVACIVYWDEIKVAAGAACDWIAAKWSGFTAWLSGVWAAMTATATGAWEALKAQVSAKINQVLVVIGFLGAIPGRVWGFFTAMVSGAIAVAGRLVAWMAGLPGRLLAAVGRLGSLLVGAGRDLVSGLGNGIVSKWTWLTDKVRGLARAALNAAKSMLGIRSPSRVFRDQIGRFIPEGVAVGISANTSAVAAATRELSESAVAAALPATRASVSVGEVPLVGAGAVAVAPAPAPEVVVKVLIDGQEFSGLVRTEIDEAHRRTRRQVGAGRGV
ncbi:Phage tail length tape-measure protein [Pseudonocardia sp. Ae168_Ps1]|uniref:phage tail protein n=1 Tax=unclassified Pseudonocardia TaxID=2619320 RepID=UPI00094B3FA0|nr:MULTISPECIES: hypothetical protein [unclassified Pseudonocardia]OLL69836.1 Phage tail length tape-measure protein pham13 [Pseudonocardia sp. Ae150A_Ps1]OLL69968.1 Phage tail length tape-measure protein [Pseudonocardia sp. Ae168_Ps1]OLL89129.1 Phage tail length tape-measure protein [Pseudonocardia sp. Ae356_Ps1]